MKLSDIRGERSLDEVARMSVDLLKVIHSKSIHSESQSVSTI